MSQSTSSESYSEWLCPRCALVLMPYGTSLCKGEFCDNKPCSTGSWYVNSKGQEGSSGIGISEIANGEEL